MPLRQPNDSTSLATEVRRRYENARRLGHSGDESVALTLDELGAVFDTTDAAIAMLCEARMEDYIQTALRAFRRAREAGVPA